MSATTIIEQELHAWLDDELTAERREAVSEWLKAHPADARRLEAYRRDGEALARLFSFVDLPERKAAKAPSRREWKRPFLRLAASIVLLLAGAAGGWLFHDRTTVAIDGIAYEAAAAHALQAYLGPELAGGDADRLAARVTDHVGARVRLPSFDDLGYRLAAVRLLPSPEGNVAQVVLRGGQGDDVSLYLRARPGAEEGAFQTVRRGSITTVFWQGDDIVCAISGTAPAELLQTIGRRVYDAIEA